MGHSCVIVSMTVLGFFMSLFVGIFHIVSFATRHWLESLPGRSTFIRLGIHEICFEGFRHPNGDYETLYYGCYNYNDDYYLQIRRYLLTDWFRTVQLLTTINVPLTIVCLGMGFVCMLFMMMERMYTPTRGKTVGFIVSSIVMFLLMLGAGLINLLAITTFYSNCWERDWLPRPEVNILGFSFWLAVAATASAFLGFCFGLIAMIFKMVASLEHKEPRPSPEMILSRR